MSRSAVSEEAEERREGGAARRVCSAVSEEAEERREGGVVW